MVVFPLFADQADNGRCVVAAGAGATIEARGAAAANRTIESEDTAALREAILRVLHDPGYAEASAEVRSAFTALPLLDDVYEGLMTELQSVQTLRGKPASRTQAATLIGRRNPATKPTSGPSLRNPPGDRALVVVGLRL